MITQKKLGDYICNELLKLGVKCIFYHGDNLRNEENMQVHSEVKDEHFKDVNHYWQQYDVVLHSSTVTAGISFDVKDYFDLQINVLSEGTCSAISFIQGCHRVRHLKEKKMITFVEPRNQAGEHVPVNITRNEYLFHN